MDPTITPMGMDLATTIVGVAPLLTLPQTEMYTRSERLELREKSESESELPLSFAGEGLPLYDSLK